MSKAKELTEQICDLHKTQKEELKKLEEQREEALKDEQFDEGAKDVHRMYMSYIKAGFTEEQAWELTTIFFTNATKKSII